MSATDVWDIEGALETAATSVFDGLMTALSSQDPVTFQKDRARVEIMAQLGAGKGHLMPSEITGLEVDVENSFRVEFKTVLVTDADMNVHRNFRSQVRHTMNRLWFLINPRMVNHEVYGPMRPGGTSPVFKNDEGYFQTQMSFSCDVAILASAWASVLPGPPPVDPPAPPTAQEQFLTEEQGYLITDPDTGLPITITQ